MYIYFNFRAESYKYSEYQHLQIIYFFHQFERNQINYRYIKLKPYIIPIEKFFSSNPNIQDFIDNNKFQVSLRKKFHTYSLEARFPSLDTRRPLLETNIHIVERSSRRDRFQSTLFAETRILYQLSDSFRDQSFIVEKMSTIMADIGPSSRGYYNVFDERNDSSRKIVFCNYCNSFFPAFYLYALLRNEKSRLIKYNSISWGKWFYEFYEIFSISFSTIDKLINQLISYILFIYLEKRIIFIVS